MHGVLNRFGCPVSPLLQVTCIRRPTTHMAHLFALTSGLYRQVHCTYTMVHVSVCVAHLMSSGANISVGACTLTLFKYY